MTATADLFSNDDLFADVFGDYETRLAAVQARIGAYHQDCSRRSSMDQARAVRDRLAGARGFLAGRYDQTYTSGLGFATVEDWRASYAQDSLRTALHELVWAEFYAGLRDRDSANADDPYRRTSST